MITVVDTTALAKEAGGHLASVDAKLPALSSGAVPVTLPTAQITALTPPTSVSVSNLPTTQVVSGAVSVSNFPATQPVSGSVTVTGTTAVSAATLPLPSGASTEATLAAVNAKLPALAAGAIPVSLPGTQAISGTVSVSNLLATQPVSGTVTANAGTNLNTSALALETGGNLATIAGRTPTLGSAVSASSSPVVIASDQTVPVQSKYTELTGLSAAALNAFLLPSTDVSGYRWISFQVTSIGGGATITLQVSNDNATWAPLPLETMTSTTSSASNVVASVALLHGPIPGHYVRAQLTAYTSGTITAVVGLHTVPAQLHDMGVQATQSGTWSVNSTPVPSAATGATPFHLVAASTNNATIVKSSSGAVQSISVTNIAAYPVYLKMYKKGTTPAPATDNALLAKVIGCPAGQNVTISFPLQAFFSSGISIAIVKGIADTDNTSVVAGDCSVDLDYL